MNELDLIKLNIYEAYDNGEITYGEKEYLLEQVNYMCEGQSTFTKKARELQSRYNSQMNGNALTRRAAATTKDQLLKMGVDPDAAIPSKREIRATGSAAKAAGKADYMANHPVTSIPKNKKDQDALREKLVAGLDKAGDTAARGTYQAARMRALKDGALAAASSTPKDNPSAKIRADRMAANAKATGNPRLSKDVYMNPKDVIKAQAKFKKDFANESAFETLLESINDLYE